MYVAHAPARRRMRYWSGRLTLVLIAAVILGTATNATGAARETGPRSKPAAKAPPSMRPGVKTKSVRSAVRSLVRRPAVRRAPHSKIRAPRAQRSGLRLAYADRPVNTSPPAVRTIPRVGSNVSLYAGTWNDVEQVLLDVYRYKGGAWTWISGTWVANGATLSYYLGTEWADSQIGFYAWGYNPTYGWSDGAWSGSYIVQPAGTPPQNTSPPSATGSFEVGSTVTLKVGTWVNAPDQYWIDLWRWTSSSGWVYVSGTNIGPNTAMPLTLGSEWSGSRLGFHAFARNSSAGWSDGVWGGEYAVADSTVVAPPATDNVDTPAVARNESGTWGFWLSNDFQATVSHYVQFQTAQSTPLVGDWDGDGIDSPGVNIGGYRWILSNGYDGEIDHDFIYGLAGDKPIVGDWNGDGIDTPGLRRNASFYLKNSHTGGDADISFMFGFVDDKPLAGDFNGDDIDTVAVHRGNVFYFKNSHTGGTADFSVGYGYVTDTPLIGDWNANGIDTPGVHRGNRFYLSNDFSGTTHYDPVYGNQGDVPLGGDWNPEPMDSWSDEAVTQYEDGTYALAAVTNDAPTYVTKYAPLVFFAQDEDNFPASAREWFLKFSALKYKRNGHAPLTIAGRGQISAIRLGEQNRNPQPYRVGNNPGVPAYELTRPFDDHPDRRIHPEYGFYLEFADDKRAGVRPGPTTPVPVYYHYANDGPGPGRDFITYWFFYPYNDGPSQGNHEGDWERVVVILDPYGTATGIKLFRHNCDVTLTWSQISKVPNSNHPIVFSASGSHGNYGTAGLHETPCGVPFDDRTSSGPAWKTWNWLADVQRQPWYGFGGAWGTVGAFKETTGPLGPSQYKDPFG